MSSRLATLEPNPKSAAAVAQWWAQHDERYAVLVALEADDVIGWASLNRFSHRPAHSVIADLSVYVARSHRGRGAGSALLQELERVAVSGAFHKIVLHALNHNEPGKQLYRKSRFVNVGGRRRNGEGAALRSGCTIGRAFSFPARLR